VTADLAKAVEYYRKSAEAGFGLGMGCLGDCYENGKGVAKDEAEAAKWYRRGADAGEPACKAQLAQIPTGDLDLSKRRLCVRAAAFFPDAAARIRFRSPELIN